MSMRNLINAVEGSASANKSLTETKYKDATEILQEATENLQRETLKEGITDKMFSLISAPIKGKIIDAIREVAQKEPDLFLTAVTNVIKAVSNATDEQAKAGAEKILTHLNGQLAESAGKRFIREMKEYVPYDSRQYMGDKMFGDWAVGDLDREDFMLKDGKFNAFTFAKSLIGGLAMMTFNVADPRWWKDGMAHRPLMTLAIGWCYWTIVQIIAWVGFDADLGWLNNAASAYTDWRMHGTNPFGPDADWSDRSWNDHSY